MLFILLEKGRGQFCPLIWYRLKKNSFGKKKLDLFLLSKTKSFGSKTSDLFWELEKKK